MPRTHGKQALVVLSGGQDSATCLFLAKRDYDRVHTIFFDYGQRHAIEKVYAHKLSTRFAHTHTVVEVPLHRVTESALIHRTIPVSERGGFDDLPTTFTPGRNLVFLTYAAIFAVSHDIKDIFTGVSQTDYSGYPDCRQPFIDSFMKTFSHAMGEKTKKPTVEIHTPLMRLSKAQTFKLAQDIGALKFIINDTMTCYHGDEALNYWGRGCTKCPACKLRAKGFEEFMSWA